jgi:short-subunit dehydrogenase
MIILRIILKIKSFGLLVITNLLSHFDTISFIDRLGASSGIGRELAKELARLSPSTRIVISSRREQELESLAAELNIDSDRCIVLPLDLEDHTYGFQGKVDHILNRFGQIDVLINNAGISQRSLVKDTLHKVDSRLMSINFLGTVTLTKTVLPVNQKKNLR